MSTYKGQTPARRKANQKYLSEKVDSINIRFPKGMKDLLREKAKEKDLSINQYCRQAIIDAYLKDCSIVDLVTFNTIFKAELRALDSKPTADGENNNTDM